LQEPPIEYWERSRVVPYANNDKLHSYSDLEEMAQSIKRHGLIEALAIRREDGAVISGHKRLSALDMLEWAKIPVRVFDYTVEEAAAARLAANKTSGNSYDDSKTAQELSMILEADASLFVGMGFDEDDLSSFDINDSLCESALEALESFGDIDMDPLGESALEELSEASEGSPAEEKNFFGIKITSQDIATAENLFNELKERGFSCTTDF